MTERRLPACVSFVLNSNKTLAGWQPAFRHSRPCNIVQNADII